MRSGGQLLREIADLADGEGSERRIVLEIVFAGEAIARVEVVVDVAADLVGLEGGLGAEDERVVTEIAVEIVFGRDEELPVGQLEVHDLQRGRTDVGGGKSGAEGGVGESGEARGVAVGIAQAGENVGFGDGAVFVGNALALIGGEEEELVFLGSDRR